MAETPAAVEPAGNRVVRNEKGQIVAGSGALGRNGGRVPVPDLYTALTPVGFAVQAALATGIVEPRLIPADLSPEQREKALKSIEDAAKAGDADPELRGKYTEVMICRTVGRPKETVEHSGPDGGALVTRVVWEFRGEEPRTKEVVGVRQPLVLDAE
jgi:hypothetical protein